MQIHFFMNFFKKKMTPWNSLSSSDMCMNKIQKSFFVHFELVY